MVTFRQAIDSVLGGHPEGMHYGTLTKEVLKVKPTKGKTPDQTVLAILSQNPEHYEKVSDGVYKRKDTVSLPETRGPKENPTGATHTPVETTEDGEEPNTVVSGPAVPSEPKVTVQTVRNENDDSGEPVQVERSVAARLARDDAKRVYGKEYIKRLFMAEDCDFYDVLHWPGHQITKEQFRKWFDSDWKSLDEWDDLKVGEVRETPLFDGHLVHVLPNWKLLGGTCDELWAVIEKGAQKGMVYRLTEAERGVKEEMEQLLTTGAKANNYHDPIENVTIVQKRLKGSIDDLNIYRASLGKPPEPYPIQTSWSAEKLAVYAMAQDVKTLTDEYRERLTELQLRMHFKGRFLLKVVQVAGKVHLYDTIDSHDEHACFSENRSEERKTKLTCGLRWRDNYKIEVRPLEYIPNFCSRCRDRVGGAVKEVQEGGMTCKNCGRPKTEHDPNYYFDATDLTERDDEDREWCPRQPVKEGSVNGGGLTADYRRPPKGYKPTSFEWVGPGKPGPLKCDFCDKEKPRMTLWEKEGTDLKLSLCFHGCQHFPEPFMRAEGKPYDQVDWASWHRVDEWVGVKRAQPRLRKARPTSLVPALKPILVSQPVEAK
jgi:hypothetical protein